MEDRHKLELTSAMVHFLSKWAYIVIRRLPKIGSNHVPTTTAMLERERDRDRERERR